MSKESLKKRYLELDREANSSMGGYFTVKNELKAISDELYEKYGVFPRVDMENGIRKVNFYV